MASDSLNQVGKYLGKTRKDAEQSLRRYAAIIPTVERARDVFDSVVPFEMEFKTTPNSLSVLLDISFTKPPPAGGCKNGCYKSTCESFDLTSSAHYITLSNTFISGGVTVFRNGAFLSESYWSTTENPREIYITGTSSTNNVITICYIIQSCCPYLDCFDRDFAGGWGMPDNMTKNGVTVLSGADYWWSQFKKITDAADTVKTDIIGWFNVRDRVGHMTGFTTSTNYLPTENITQIFPHVAQTVGHYDHYVEDGYGIMHLQWTSDNLHHGQSPIHAQLSKIHIESWPIIIEYKARATWANPPTDVVFFPGFYFDTYTAFKNANGTPTVGALNAPILDSHAYQDLIGVELDILMYDPLFVRATTEFLHTYTVSTGDPDVVEQITQEDPIEAYSDQLESGKFYTVKAYINLEEPIRLKIWKSDEEPEPPTWESGLQPFRGVVPSTGHSIGNDLSFALYGVSMEMNGITSPGNNLLVEVDYVDIRTSEVLTF